MANGTPAYQQTVADGTFPPKAFTQAGYHVPVTLTKSDCEQKLKEAYEEIERLRAEVARLQAERDGGVVMTRRPPGWSEGYGYQPPNLHGDGL